MLQRNSARQGFTLLEILMVIGLIMILSFILVPAGINLFERGKKQSAQIELNKIKGAVDLYHSDTGQYPETLRDLIQPPAEEELAKSWGGPYMKDLPKDPWKRAYQYMLNTEGSEHEYELFSYGKGGSKAKATERISVWKQ